MFYCSHRLLCWINSRVRDFLWKLLSFHTKMISTQFLWGIVFLRGDLRKYAKKFKFWKFWERPLFNISEYAWTEFLEKIGLNFGQIGGFGREILRKFRLWSGKSGKICNFCWKGGKNMLKWGSKGTAERAWKEGLRAAHPRTPFQGGTPVGADCPRTLKSGRKEKKKGKGGKSRKKVGKRRKKGAKEKE